MKDLRAANQILGMRTNRHHVNKKLKLSLAEYIVMMHKKFNMRGSKLVNIPLTSHF